MLLYLMRHGIATPRGELGLDDASRALTPEGAEKVRRIGGALQRLKVEVDEIWTSSLLRAQQTAEITAGIMGITSTLRIVREIEPGGDLQSLIEQLGQKSGLRGIMLVGHEPDMGQLASMLLCGRLDASIRFKKGGVACLEVTDGVDPGCRELQWLLTPKQMTWLA